MLGRDTGQDPVAESRGDRGLEVGGGAAGAAYGGEAGGDGEQLVELGPALGARGQVGLEAAALAGASWSSA